MSGHVDVLTGAGAGIVVVVLVASIIGLTRPRAGLTHVVWGAGFVVVVWISALIGDGEDGRIALLTAMVTIWGTRLAVYHGWRSRQDPAPTTTIRSRASALTLEGVLLFVVALPVMLAMTPVSPAIGCVSVVGVVIWGVGLFVEAVADVQFDRFHAIPGNQGRDIDRGLWRFGRRPTHVGNACVWWGMFLVAAETSDARLGVIGPLLMTFLLQRRTGALLARRPIKVIPSDV